NRVHRTVSTRTRGPFSPCAPRVSASPRAAAGLLSASPCRAPPPWPSPLRSPPRALGPPPARPPSRVSVAVCPRAAARAGPPALGLDRGIDPVAHRAPSAAGAGSAGELAAQPVLVLEPVERRLDRIVGRQVAPLVAAHVAQREAVFECAALQLGGQGLRRP